MQQSKAHTAFGGNGMAANAAIDYIALTMAATQTAVISRHS